MRPWSASISLSHDIHHLLLNIAEDGLLLFVVPLCVQYFQCAINVDVLGRLAPHIAGKNRLSRCVVLTCFVPCKKSRFSTRSCVARLFQRVVLMYSAFGFYGCYFRRVSMMRSPSYNIYILVNIYLLIYKIACCSECGL
jgi:hypothetical protein